MGSRSIFGVNWLIKEFIDLQSICDDIVFWILISSHLCYCQYKYMYVLVEIIVVVVFCINI